jgi:hypothetical protein
MFLQEENKALKYQMRVGQRFTAIYGVGCAMDLRDSDLHSTLPIHVTLRHKFKIKSATLDKTKLFYFIGNAKKLNNSLTELKFLRATIFFRKQIYWISFQSDLMSMHDPLANMDKSNRKTTKF